MKLRMPKIDEAVFYSVGKYAFLVTGLITFMRVVDLWTTLEAYDIFSSLAMGIFYFVLGGYFSYMKNNLNIKEVDDKDIFKMNQALENLNLDTDKNAKRKGKAN